MLYGRVLRAEKDLETFFILRLREGSRFPGTRGRWWGISSDALIDHAVTGRALDEHEYPRDEDDLMSCERTLQRLPLKYLTPEVRRTMGLFRAHVEHKEAERKAARKGK